MTFLFRLSSKLPLWWLHAWGALLGWVVFILSARYRQRFLENAELAGYGFSQIRSAIAHAGRMSAEVPRLWLGAPVPVTWGDTQAVERAMSAGSGVIFLTPHMGCFEVVGQAVAQRYATQDGPLTVLYRPARQAWLADLMRVARQRPGLQAVPTNLTGVRLMIKALRQGQPIGLLPDQVPPSGMGIWAPFFGRDAYTMTLSARLAQQTSAQILLAWGERLPWGRGFALHFRALSQPLSPQLEVAVTQINQEMERLIRECPQQYLWAYGRYKQPRQET